MATRGQKRHLITLVNPGAVVPDNEGGYTQVSTNMHPKMYAEIKPASARDLERVFAGTVLATASHLVTLDYRSDVTTKTTVKFGTREFAISGIQNPDERDRELILACTEVV